MTASNRQSNKSSKRRQKRKLRARAAFTSKPNILLKRDDAGIVGELLSQDHTDVIVDIPGYQQPNDKRPMSGRWINASVAAVSTAAASVSVYVSSAASLLKSNG